MLTSIDVKFIFESALLGLFSSTNILQIADVALLSSYSFCHDFSYYFSSFLLLKRVKCLPFYFHIQNNLASSPGLLG